MKINPEQYQNMVKQRAKKSPLAKDLLAAFLTGGAICCAGQALQQLYESWGCEKSDASLWASITLIFISVLLTGLGLYDSLAKHAGGGTLVPITGFANSVASPAIEFKAEGFVTGMAVKIFSIAGPVIVFGIAASVVYGLVLQLIP